MNGDLHFDFISRQYEDEFEKEDIYHDGKKDINLLCSNYPPEFQEYFTHCSTLGFEDAPNYKCPLSPLSFDSVTDI